MAKRNVVSELIVDADDFLRFCEKVDLGTNWQQAAFDDVLDFLIECGVETFVQLIFETCFYMQNKISVVARLAQRVSVKNIFQSILVKRHIILG